MFTILIKKFMLRVANMGKKAALVWCILLTLDFFASLFCLLFGILLIKPDGTGPEYAIPLTIVGAVLLFICTFMIMLTTVSSNYIKAKNKNEDEDINKDNN